jgi:peptide/nickel transport system ATP-binding protein
MVVGPVVVPLVTPAVDPNQGRAPGTRPAPALEVLGVTKAFQLGTGRKKSTLQALAGVDLAVAPGESLAIVGESGCGKSTLLRVMAGLLKPDAGEVILMPRQQPQMIFQDAGASLTPWLTVEDLVGERLRGQGIGRKERHDAVLDTLRLVGAPVDIAGARAAELSGGQRQRVAIARAVIRPPSVLLCDEPTSALDVSLAATVLNMLSDLRRRFGMSIIFVTHDLAAARMVADRIAVMNKGQVVEVGDVDAVCNHPRSEYTRTLLAAMPQLGPAAAEPRRAAG